MATVITSISGLQNLTNLVDFRADWNSLTTVDLSGLTNLVYVDVSDCNVIGGGDSSLTSIDVTGCTSLNTLNIDDSDFSENGIDSIIGKSSLSNLERLDIDDSGLSGTIDLSIFPSLDDVDLSSNSAITVVNILNTQPITDFNANGCSLTEESVDNILTVLSLNGQSNGYVDLQGGNNALPSDSGSAAKTVLEGNNWTVYVNSI